MAEINHLLRVRVWVAIFITGLLVSGVTAFPLQSELRWLVDWLGASRLHESAQAIDLLPWLERVETALVDANARYPFLAYGTDWLAFAHIVIAIAFLGPLADPLRNKWVIQFGLMACAGVIPLALIAGPIRGIPLPWRLVDCSFGVFGSIPLLICLRSVRALESRTNQTRVVGAR